MLDADFALIDFESISNHGSARALLTNPIVVLWHV